jgi:hypothetical protein
MTKIANIEKRTRIIQHSRGILQENNRSRKSPTGSGMRGKIVILKRKIVIRVIVIKALRVILIVSLLQRKRVTRRSLLQRKRVNLIARKILKRKIVIVIKVLLLLILGVIKALGEGKSLGERRRVIPKKW